MFTAMYEFKDEYGTRYARNAKIGGYKRRSSALKAVLRKSPIGSGTIQIGLKIVAVIHNGKELTV